jgi:DNA segregation ATPase FtsK/SpoIIIE, S-DNA-T family
MAKRKKTTKRIKVKDLDEASKKQSFFWRQVTAFILIVLALFILLGGFELGGPLPVKMFEWLAWAFGLVAYVVPFILIYLAIVKLKSEEHKIPISKIISSLFFLVFLSGMLHVFVDSSESAAAAAKGTYGGEVGHYTSRFLLSFLSPTVAFIVFIVLAWISLMFMLKIPPKSLFIGIANLFRRKNKDTDLTSVENSKDNFTVHEGVPVVHHDKADAKAIGLASLKSSAAKLAPPENHAALMAASDPDWRFPTLNLLNSKQDRADPGDTKARAEKIRTTLAEMGVAVEMEGANVGPRVTQYTLLPLPGQKLNKIESNEQNISYELGGVPLRIEAPIPGKRAVGIEVPNVKPATVRLHSILNSPEWTSTNKPLSFAVGKDISGKPIAASLDKMPHLLVAGQTGSGKSVMINSIIASFVFRNSPSDLRLILIDPKHVEMAPYHDIPHLLTPVITEPEKCISALKWSVAEMERRLKTFSAENRGNIAEYNADRNEDRMPYIVIIIDEMADFMMAAGRDMEMLIARIAQKARASGIHLILATQRPDVKIVTGLIKANVPARIAFTVVSEVDSRVIIGYSGAEKLLNDGDLLFLTAEMPKPIRLQGGLIEKNETIKICDFLRSQSSPNYNDEVISMPVQLSGRGSVVVDSMSDGEDLMWEDAVRVVVESGKASTSLLQRRLRIGYGRASRIIDEMEQRGVVGPASGSRPREVLVSSEDEVFSSGSSDETYEDGPLSDDPQDEYLTR